MKDTKGNSIARKPATSLVEGQMKNVRQLVRSEDVSAGEWYFTTWKDERFNEPMVEKLVKVSKVSRSRAMYDESITGLGTSHCAFSTAVSNLAMHTSYRKMYLPSETDLRIIRIHVLSNSFNI